MASGHVNRTQQAEHMAAPTNAATWTNPLPTRSRSLIAPPLSTRCRRCCRRSGVTVLSAVGRISAATSGPKHRRCNVHSELASHSRSPRLSLAAARTFAPPSKLHLPTAIDRLKALRSSADDALLYPAERFARTPNAVQDYRELPCKRHARLASTRPPGDRMCPVFQARCTPYPRQDYDSCLVH
jgi:hypothetical protein